MNKNNLAGWLFNFNPHTNIWRAVKKEDYFELDNNYYSEKVIRSSRIETLIDIVVSYDGDVTKLDLLKVIE